MQTTITPSKGGAPTAAQATNIHPLFAQILRQIAPQQPPEPHYEAVVRTAASNVLERFRINLDSISETYGVRPEDLEVEVLRRLAK